MVTSMIPSVDNIFVNKSIIDMRFLSPYNPLINYDWSTTTAKEYKTDGVELVINGGFDTDIGWIRGTGWSIIDGTATITTRDSNIYQAGVFVVGETYKITYDVVSAGGGRINFRMPSDANYYIANTSGTHTIYVKATFADLMFRNESTTSTCKIDNISVQKVIQEPNKRYLKDVGSTPTYNASMYFGRGAYLNGVDQTITIPINTTIQTALKRVNGVITINETSQTLTDYVISGLGVHKDYYLFTRLLTTAEKDSYTNTPELFYAMAQADSTCVLNMPMCETSSTVRNYKTGIDYVITNYTSSVRDNAKNLQYGLQTCKFVRDSLGVIQSASDYLACDGAGYADTRWIPDLTKDFSLETICVVGPSSDGTVFIIGVSKGNTIRFLFRDGYCVINIGNASTVITSPRINQKIYGVLTYNSITKSIKIYFGDNLNTSQTLTTLTAFTGGVYLGGTNETSSYRGTTPIRLFKVHNKELTQAEITDSYNSYTAKGLLS